MAKLKSFEQFLSEMDRAEEVQQDVVAAAEPVEHSEEEAEEVQGNGDAVEESNEEVNEGLHPKLKKAQKAIKKGETVYGENVRFPGRFKILELGDMFATVDYEDGTKPMEMASMNIAIDSLQFESVETETIEESCDACNEEPCVCETEQVSESGEEAGLPAEDLKDETKEVDNDVEAPEDKSDELEAELEDTVDAAGDEEISEDTEAIEESEESEDVEATEESEEAEEVEETKAVSDMLMEVYESACKNEAKAWEEDAHDEHTIETYMKENAALVGGLAAKCLKEMKEDYSVEAYEAACNEMIEAYSKKVNEMKESDSAVGEETPEA